MKILGVSGSPAKEGITSHLLDKALEGARSRGAVAEKVILNDLSFRPCQQCGGCDETGVCVLKDDMTPLYKRIEDADGIIISSPIFFGTVSAQTKMMIDRFQSAWVKKYVLKTAKPASAQKKGLFLCAAGSDKEEFFESAKKVVKIFFATLNIKYCGDLFYKGADDKHRTKNREEALNRAFELGASISG